MQIVVTEWNIDDGRQDDRTECPIALALWEQTGYPWYVDRGCCGIEDLGLDVELPLPESARLFVKLFDSGAAVAPFAFELPWEEAGDAGLVG